MNMPIAKAARTGWLLACMAVVGLACMARLYHVTHPVLWLDEAYSVTLAGMPLAQIILHTARDVHPPLYYLLLHFWMDAFGNSLLAVRGMSVFLAALPWR
jgi:Predicted membrane protein